MNKGRLRLLFKKYIQKDISDTERSEFFHLVHQPMADKILREFSREFDIPDRLWERLPEDATKKILQSIFKNQSPNNKLTVVENADKENVKVVKWWKTMAAAVAVLLVIVGAGYYYSGAYIKNKASAIAKENRVIKDAPPGKTGAILTLSNGESFLLDTIQNATLKPGIVKSDSVLELNGANELNAMVETPMARQQTLLLSDGTRVWLNAGSSIKFPLAFKHERKVEITGEAFFEVSHDARRPFIVKTGKEEIVDLGTRFNVNAYKDEMGVTTTLVEGRVQINNHILKPGDQHINNRISKVDVNAVIAWVSGYFYFDHTDLKSVMRQISRWYNVSVEYQGNIPVQYFDGEIQQSLNLSQVLELLNATGIHYTLDGKRLTIRP
ncbi:FecR family protein [Niabella aquatica]